MGQRAWMIMVGCIFVVLLPALAHEGDEKLRDWKPPTEAPIWRADDAGTSFAPPQFRASGVRLMAWFPIKTFHPSGTSASDVWGYESPSGREYALLGHSNGTGIVEVTQPGSSRVVKFLDGPVSVWRNVKTYGSYLYAVSEGGGGIQVFDLSRVDEGVVTQLPSVDGTGSYTTTHTMLVNQATGFLYRLGGAGYGVRVYDLKQNPAAPRLVGAWATRYIHDGAIHSYTSGAWAGREILFACGGLNNGYLDPRLEILDVTNKAGIVALGSVSYPQAKYCHGIAISSDGRTGWINDEMDEQNGQFSRGITVDLSDLSRPAILGFYTSGERTVDHNNYALGNRLYCSNYASGLRIFDVSVPENPVQIAWFDSYPADDAAPVATYNGLWSNYPYFRSGTVVGSDINGGLFVWKVEGAAGRVTLDVADGGWRRPEGQVLEVHLENLRPDLTLTGTPEVAGTVGTASFRAPLDPIGESRWMARMPEGSCGSSSRWCVEFPLSDGSTLREPFYGMNVSWLGLGEHPVVTDSFETNSGWTVGVPGDNATAGTWSLVVPIGTAAQPGSDHSPDGTRCWVTANGSDIDLGRTTLVSPDMDLEGLREPMLSYWRWYTNSTGGTHSGPYYDSLVVSASGDGGVTWVDLESVQDVGLGWFQARFRLRDVLPADARKIRLRFAASDFGTDSTVEAAIDDLQLADALCDEADACDLDRSRHVDFGDVNMVLLHWGSPLGSREDLDLSGVVDMGDVALVMLNQGPVP